jgi:hypothetical protein
MQEFRENRGIIESWSPFGTRLLVCDENTRDIGTMTTHLSLELYFAEDPHGLTAPSLAETSFSISSDGPSFRCSRGRGAGPRQSWGSFQWSHAVRAFAALSLRHHLAGMPGMSHVVPYIEGEAGSAAASLDYAISKEPQWMCDMFGLSPVGKMSTKSIFLRTNPNRKLPGAVLVGLNSQSLAPAAVRIFLDHRIVDDGSELISLLAALERSDEPFVQPGLLAGAGMIAEDAKKR